MKRILCFGDSNTWGYVPGTDGARYPDEQRWPGVAAACLGDAYCLIEEALNGRTTVWDDPLEAGRRGSDHLPWLLEAHRPLDLVIVLLGTNDSKRHYGHDAATIALGAGFLIDLIRSHPTWDREGGAVPEVLLVSPAPVSDGGAFGALFEGRETVSAQLAETYAAVAADRGVPFFAAGSVASCLTRAEGGDGIHLDAPGYAALGAALAEEIRKLLG